MLVVTAAHADVRSDVRELFTQDMETPALALVSREPIIGVKTHRGDE
jgi:hypothetical protein